MMSNEIQSTPAVQSGNDAWGYSAEVASCAACGASFLIPAGSAVSVCPACFGGELHPNPDHPLRANPELILPFEVDAARAQAIFTQWASSPRLRAPDMDGKGLCGRMARVYLPMWLVDGQVSGGWQAQAGYAYQVASSRDSFAGGQWTSQQVNETRLRWEPRVGTIQRSYQNLAVQALESHVRLASQAGTFPIQKATAYAANQVSGAFVLLPDIPPEKAFPLAKTQFDRAASVDCQTAVGAQSVDQISLTCEYDALNWTLLLLPVVTSYYREENGTLHPVLINAATGQVTGVKRASQSRAWRWTGAMAAIGVACILAAILIGLLAALLPPVAILSGLLLLVGAGLTLASPAPAIWAWQYNKHTE